MNVVNSSQKRCVGRRAGNTDTQMVILRAAQELFAENGLDQTTMRQIGKKAQVDPALVVYYFKSKQQLFVKSMEPILHERDLGKLFGQLKNIKKSEIGQKLAEILVGGMQDKMRNTVTLGLIKSALSDPEALVLLRQSLNQTFSCELGKHLTGADIPLKAAFISSQMIGLLFVRYVARLEPIASAPPEELVQRLAPVLQIYFE